MDRLTAEEKIRYGRNILISGIGEDGQRKLAEGSVFIIGCGALGSIASLYLAGAGVGKIVIADYDKVDISNLQRQLSYTTADIGKSKAEKLAERMKDLNPEVTVECVNRFITPEIARYFISRADFVIDGSDNKATKYMTDAICTEMGVPYCIGGVSEMRGQFITYVPGSATYSDIFPESSDQDGITPCSVGGVLGPMPGIIGSFQAAEAIKYITGCGRLFTDRMTVIDLRNAMVNSYEV